MLRLRSNSVFREFLEFDPTIATTRQVKLSLAEAKEIQINGVFDKLDNDLALLYFFDGNLQLRIASNAVVLGSDITVELLSTGNSRELVVMKNGLPVFRKQYRRTHFPIAWDPTPFVEEEDFDFGLFIANIAASPERQKIASQAWQQPH
jgi:hypothetical protein